MGCIGCFKGCNRVRYGIGFGSGMGYSFDGYICGFGYFNINYLV